MSYATSPDGTRIWWTETGAGHPLLLVPGFASSHRSWRRLTPLLAEHFRVIVFDHRGTGESDRPKGRYTLATMAADAVSVLDAAGQERAAVFGTSMGGLITQHLMLEHRTRLTHAVLGCTMAPGEGAVRGSRKGLLTFAVAPLRSQQGRVELARTWVVHPDSSPAAVRELLDETKDEKVPLATCLRMAAGQRGFETASRLGQVTTPTLIVHGKDDRLVPVVNAHRMHSAIRGSELVLLNRAGHDLSFDQPTATVDAVASFVNGRQDPS